MGISKTELFGAEQNELARLAKVLSHPARLAILEYIAYSKSCICGSLVDELGLAQATISQHLKELKNLGLIEGSIEGRTICYCINTEAWQAMQALFNSFFNLLSSTKKTC